jgi:hypothetical protein
MVVPLAARRHLFLVVGLLGGLLMMAEQFGNPVVAATGPARPTLTPGSSHQGISFRDRLIAGLEARRPSEVEFIDAVVLKVRLGRLPERLVNQTFFWSRDRANRTGNPRGTQRPIIYFQPVMSAQAKRLGVAL